MDIEQAIQLAIKGHSTAQRFLYEKYKVQLYTVCLRYGRDRSEAEDILQEGFIKILKDLHQYTGKGSIGGWMRKVMVNTALQYLRKWKKDWNHLDSQDYQEAFQVSETVFHKLGLNLYVIEGYAHKEIADLLGVSENTSKTQLFKAKAALRKKLEKQLLSR